MEDGPRLLLTILKIMVRRSKTIQEVIKESKIYLKNTQNKNKVVLKGSRSILETIKEGLAYL